MCSFSVERRVCDPDGTERRVTVGRVVIGPDGRGLLVMLYPLRGEFAVEIERPAGETESESTNGCVQP